MNSNAPTTSGDTIDWLQKLARSESPALTTAAELFGRLAFLAASLRRAPDLPSLPTEHRSALEAAFSVVPLQAPTMPPDSPGFSWLQVASLAEFYGQRELARMMVDSLAVHAGDDPELMAMCEGQRGRIARTGGNLDDAEAHYTDAIRRTAPHIKRDAWTRALCGLANVHIDRGNYPAAERCLRRALTAGRQVAAATRVHPWMGLAMVRRKRGDHVDAMLCAWNAFDLTVPGTQQRADLLITLAECAAELGDHSAAVNGFVQALHLAGSLRLRAAAITGLVQAVVWQASLGRQDDAPSAALGNESRMTPLRAVALLDDLLAGPLAPQEYTLALLVRAEASLTLFVNSDGADHARVDEYLDKAREFIDRHGYNEYRFRLERIAAGRTSGSVPAATSFRGREQQRLRAPLSRPTALQRLADYSIDAAALTQAD